MPDPTENLTDSAERLAELRREIDAVDAELHDLVMRRTRLSAHMGALKTAAPGGTGPAEDPFRPAREAAILRRLAERHRGAPPFEVIVQIWRELITANLRRQCAFGLAVLETSHGGLREAARSGFGALTPVTSHARPRDVIDAVAATPGLLGIFPAPARAAPELRIWPELLAEAPALRILSSLPVISPDNQAAAYVVGRAPLEASGDDITLVLLTGTAPFAAEAELAGAGLQGHIDATWPGLYKPGLYCAFAAVQGFLSPSESALTCLAAGRRRDGGTAVRLGSMPAPIRPPAA